VKCRAIYDYVAQRPDELSLKIGDIVNVLAKQEDSWWLGSLRGAQGVFPSTFVEQLPESTPANPVGGNSIAAAAAALASKIGPQNSPPSTPKLPPGWQEVFTDAGEKYYYNENTDETSWEIPTA
jgi:hypothetical protein